MPIKHGLYSKVVPAPMQESYRAASENPDPNSMREHIALIDGMIWIFMVGSLRCDEPSYKDKSRRRKHGRSGGWM